jgi:hypothetical protein
MAKRGRLGPKSKLVPVSEDVTTDGVDGKHLQDQLASASASSRMKSRMRLATQATEATLMRPSACKRL